MTILNRQHLRTFHRKLYAGFLEAVTLLKRDDDQRAGTVRELRLFNLRWSRIYKTGEPIAGDLSSNQSRTLHIPVSELDRVGVDHINAADRFVDKEGRTWEPESTTTITNKLAQTHLCVPCLRNT